MALSTVILDVIEHVAGHKAFQGPIFDVTNPEAAFMYITKPQVMQLGELHDSLSEKIHTFKHHLQFVPHLLSDLMTCRDAVRAYALLLMDSLRRNCLKRWRLRWYDVLVVRTVCYNAAQTVYNFYTYNGRDYTVGNSLSVFMLLPDECYRVIGTIQDVTNALAPDSQPTDVTCAAYATAVHITEDLCQLYQSCQIQPPNFACSLIMLKALGQEPRILQQHNMRHVQQYIVAMLSVARLCLI